MKLVASMIAKCTSYRRAVQGRPDGSEPRWSAGAAIAPAERLAHHLPAGFLEG